jgi:hypothetical protein
MIDPVSPIATLKESVEKQLTSARLQELTRLVIEAHRGGDVALLRAYAERAGLGPEVVSAPARTLFYRIVAMVHPDKLPHLCGDFRSAIEREDVQALEKLSSLLAFRRSASVPKRRVDFDIRDYREEHIWDDGIWGCVDDADAESRWEDAEGLSFLDAVKLDSVGNLDIEISPFELSHLDGPLDVSHYGLYDLDGFEFCTNISALDASWNNLTSVGELGSSDHLVELYLAGNGICDITPLAGISSLEIIDLEDNEIEDIAPLLELAALRFVNLRGNPIEERHLVDDLIQTGVVVVL